MKVELCSFSGFKIYPGHGSRYIKADGKSFHFVSRKSKMLHLTKRNPRKISWTVLYRRKHKKGQVEEITKRKTRKTQKFQKAVAGATISEIMAKRNQKPEVRKAQREQAIRAYKEKQKAKAVVKKPAPQPTKSKGKGKAPKTAASAGKSTGRVGGKR
ncbi:large ribosomal subunit protein eL24-like [Watersipora subatra]|uniref:large ribosomal subunit protein eL24-like n=1 Tax=Watersipora subatra TaxID=2589382 RepID=UPI00355BA620